MGKPRGRRTQEKVKSNDETTDKFAENQDFISLPDADELPDAQQQTTVFFGLLDRSELEYFKTAESTLAANALTNEEREPFINSLFEEIKRKELKLATHQLCSKLIERLLLLADDHQLISMLQAFSGHFYKLAIAKYSSHCLETLLIRCANVLDNTPGHEIEVNGEVTSTENLMLYAFNELLPHVSELAKDTYGSHVLRLILLLVSGLPLGQDAALRSKKSGLARKHTDMSVAVAESRVAPTSFQEFSGELVATLTKDQDATSLRRMVIDPLGSPLVQVIIRVQADKSNFSVVDMILSPQKEDSKVFVDHLLTDATGCHFLEGVIGSLPKKKLAPFYTTFLKEQVVKQAKSDYGNYVVQALLKSKLGAKPELITALMPEAPELVRSNRSQVVAQMIEYATVDVRPKVLEAVLKDTKTEELFESSKISDALFIETLLKYSPQLSTKLVGQLTSTQDAKKLENMCVHPVQSHIIEALLDPSVPQIERRKILNLFVPITVDLACNVYGSHIVDKLGPFCYKLKFVRERIADELTKNEEKVKHSVYGKNVWKNWALDKYAHKRHEWWTLIKQQEDELASKIGPTENKSEKRQSGKFKTPKRHKTPYDRPKGESK